MKYPISGRLWRTSPRPNGRVCSYSMSLLLPFNVWKQRLLDDALGVIGCGGSTLWATSVCECCGRRAEPSVQGVIDDGKSRDADWGKPYGA
jgi:hypothetical protein